MNRILVALDASDRAPVVLRSAIGLAKLTGAKLLLLRAVTMPVDLPSSLLSVSPETALTTLHDEAKRQLDALAQDVPAGQLAGTQVRVGGAPWQAVCDAAREENASLILLGSHGYGGLDRLLGTTASKVVNHADRSVLVVRAPELLEMPT